MTCARSWMARAGETTTWRSEWGPLEMESPLRLVARFLLAGLHRGQPSESAFREGQGTVLAASLYQSGALDYRASPGATGAVGDIATGLSMRD